MKTKLKHKHVKENNKIKKNNNNNRTALPKISGSQRKFHSVEIALNKKINGNGKVYKIYEIPFSHRKNHPVLQISPTFLLVVLRQKANRCLCSPGNLLFYKKPLSYTFEHRSIKSQRFHFEEHFHRRDKRFLLCERTCPDIPLQIS